MGLLNLSNDGIFLTIQGEGPDIGKPCMFLRLQSCPVQCPGCDTHYTWDGSEQGVNTALSWIDQEIARLVRREGSNLEDLGLVVSGGEPLLYYQNPTLLELISRPTWKWTGLETSGYAGAQDFKQEPLREFLQAFSSVSLSLKVTPCLHGRQSDEELLKNAGAIQLLSRPGATFLKFVVKGQADLDVILALKRHFPRWFEGRPVYLMPYGNEPSEILASVEWLVPVATRYGFYITPRLHALLWGAKRGV